MTDEDEVRRTWDAVAAAWDERRDELSAFTAPVMTKLLDELDAGADDVVLELATGTGVMGLRLAPHVREVVCTDLAPQMVAATRRRADEAGVGNVRVEVADAQDLPYDEDAFDGVVCQMAFMLMPRPADAFRECRRVLRAGGRLALSTWGAAERNPWILLLGGALLQHGHEVQADPQGAGGIFSLSEPERLRELATAAGFDEVRTEAVPLTERFATFDAYWDRHAGTGGPIAVVLAELPDDEVAAVRETCRGFAEGFRVADGYEFPAEALVTVAT